MHLIYSMYVHIYVCTCVDAPHIPYVHMYTYRCTLCTVHAYVRTCISTVIHVCCPLAHDARKKSMNFVSDELTPEQKQLQQQAQKYKKMRMSRVR